ncbi:hypothetical protein [Companilactobacillus sp. DQM5]|uniref:hypothetical protein n=1 Tax=Companilactobacillus sp. DQM5 TaxID=3463359 RepID=UPI0040584EF1
MAGGNTLYYDKLAEYHGSLKKGLKHRRDKLNDLKNSLQVLSGSQNLNGAAADSISNYINEVHISGIINELQTVITNYEEKLNILVGQYISVDQGDNFRIIDEDFTAHMHEIQTAKDKYADVVASALRTMNSVDDIVNTSSKSDLKTDGKHLSENLTKMHNYAKNEQKSWHEFEKTRANDMDAPRLAITSIERIVNQYAGGSTPSMEGYTSGGFDAVAGSDFLNMMGAISTENSTMKSASDDFSKYIKNALSDQASYRKKVKKMQKEQNQREGAASFWTDVFFIGVGAVITIASGGLAAPLALVAIGGAFTLSDTYADFDKMMNGKNEGDNFAKEFFESVGKYSGVNKEFSDNVYGATEFVASVGASGSSYKSLAKGGYFIQSKNASKPLVKTFMKEDMTAAKSAFFNNAKNFRQTKGLANGVFVKLNHVAKVHSGQTTKSIIKTYGKGALSSYAKSSAANSIVSQFDDDPESFTSQALKKGSNKIIKKGITWSTSTAVHSIISNR